MTNSSEESTTSAPDSPTSPIGTGFLFAGLVCSFVAAIITTIMGVFVPKFADVFADLGADLPLITRFVIHYYLLIWAVPTVVFCTWRFWPNNRRRNLAVALV